MGWDHQWDWRHRNDNNGISEGWRNWRQRLGSEENDDSSGAEKPAENEKRRRYDISERREVVTAKARKNK